jgi:hypothetical protein
MRWWRGLDPAYRRFLVSVLLAYVAASLIADALNLSGLAGFLVRIIIIGATFVPLFTVLALALFDETTRPDNDKRGLPGASSGSDLDSSPPESG